MLSSVAKAASTQEHCVRCHETFYENQNHQEACAIDHNEEDGNSVFSELKCCDSSWYPKRGESPPPQPCILAKHTTNPKDVRYFDEDEGGGNENVISCEERGCVKKKRKGASTGGPTKKK